MCEYNAIYRTFENEMYQSFKDPNRKQSGASFNQANKKYVRLRDTELKTCNGLLMFNNCIAPNPRWHGQLGVEAQNCFFGEFPIKRGKYGVLYAHIRLCRLLLLWNRRVFLGYTKQSNKHLFAKLHWSKELHSDWIDVLNSLVKLPSLTQVIRDRGFYVVDRNTKKVLDDDSKLRAWKEQIVITGHPVWTLECSSILINYLHREYEHLQGPLPAECFKKIVDIFGVRWNGGNAFLLRRIKDCGYYFDALTAKKLAENVTVESICSDDDVDDSDMSSDDSDESYDDESCIDSVY